MAQKFRLAISKLSANSGNSDDMNKFGGLLSWQSQALLITVLKTDLPLIIYIPKVRFLP